VILVALAAILAGLVLGFYFKIPLDDVWAAYIGLGVLSGIDSVMGGIRSHMEGKFYTDIFLTGFFGNILLASGLGWMGVQMSINLFVVVAFVLGWRIFTNLSLIRRILLTRWREMHQRKRLEAERDKTEREKQELASTS
jgi:small basic protein